MSRFQSLCRNFRKVGQVAVSDVLDLVFPRQCRVCATPLPEDPDPLCTSCSESIVWIGPSCSHCGMAILNPSPDGCCRECRGRGFSFDTCRAAALYDGCLRELILLHKYRGVPQVCSYLARLLEETWRTPCNVPEPGRVAGGPVLVPVPAHPLRNLWRGRDPLRELVLALAKRTQLTVAPFLGRRRYTRSQTRLPRERRVRNPRGSFRLRRGVVVPDHVILIDDVVTTGATVSEAARMLRKGGAQRIDVLAVARSCGP